MQDAPDVRRIAVSAIDTDDWPEPDFDFSTSLTERIRVMGLLHPISVMAIPDTDRYKLVAGRHRLDAAQRLEWDTIPASVLPYDEVEAELFRITENMDRRDLSWLERAENVFRWDELLTERGQRAPAGRPKRDWQNPITVVGLWTTQDMANKLGVSPMTVKRQVRIVGSLSKEVRDQARDIPELVNSYHELEALANLPDDAARMAVLRYLHRYPTPPQAARTVAGAHQALINRYAFCPTCDSNVDTIDWPYHSGEWRLWHCSLCGQHAQQTYDPNQVCGNCGQRRVPKDQPAIDQQAAIDPDPAPDPTAADPNQSFAQASTATSQAMHDQPAALPPSPHAQAKTALDQVNYAAEQLLKLQADVLGKQIADDHDPAYMEHARRTASQLEAWLNAFQMELF